MEKFDAEQCSDKGISCSSDMLSDWGARESDAGGLQYIKILEEGTYYRKSFRLNDDLEVEEFVQELDISSELLSSLVENFETDKERKQDRPIDYNHDMGNPLSGGDSRTAHAAAGWVKDLKLEGKDLLAGSDFTDQAREDVKDGRYRYASITFHPDWLDFKLGRSVGPKMLSYALTNTPFMENLGPIELSRDSDGQSEIYCFTRELPEATGDTNMAKEVVELSRELGEARAKHEAEVKEFKVQLENKDKEVEKLSKMHAEAISAKDAELESLSKKNDDLNSANVELLSKQQELNVKNIELAVEQDFKAGKFSSVAEKDAMLQLAKSDKESYDSIMSTRKARADFRESGSSYSADEDAGAMDFNQAVDAIKAREKCSYNEAADIAMREHHDLWEKHVVKHRVQ